MSLKSVPIQFSVKMDFVNNFDRSLKLLDHVSFKLNYPKNYRRLVMKYAALFQISGLMFTVMCQLSFMFNNINRGDILEATKGFQYLVVMFNMVFRLSTFYYYRRKIVMLKKFLINFLSSNIIWMTLRIQEKYFVIL